MNGEVQVGESSFTSDGGSRGSKLKMPNPDPLAYKATPVEYRHWKSSMMLKMEVEGMDEMQKKALAMMLVKGEASKNSLMILPETLGKTYSGLTIDDLFKVLDSKYTDLFEKENARHAFKVLVMKPF